MTSGWIKLHRAILGNRTVMKDKDHLAIWVYLLLNAAYVECVVTFGGRKVSLNPGELVTSRSDISEKLVINESKVQRTLKLFETEQQIEQRTDHQNRIISILNWEEYQSSEQLIEQRVNNERTTSEQRVNNVQLYKNYNNINNINNINARAREGNDNDNSVDNLTGLGKMRADYFKDMETNPNVNQEFLEQLKRIRERSAVAAAEVEKEFSEKKK